MVPSSRLTNRNPFSCLSMVRGFVFAATLEERALCSPLLRLPTQCPCVLPFADEILERG